jgi:hypothetical protein
VWQRKAAYLMVARKQRDREGETARKRMETNYILQIHASSDILQRGLIS